MPAACPSSPVPGRIPANARCLAGPETPAAPGRGQIRAVSGPGARARRWLPPPRRPCPGWPAGSRNTAYRSAAPAHGNSSSGGPLRSHTTGGQLRFRPAAIAGNASSSIRDAVRHELKTFDKTSAYCANCWRQNPGQTLASSVRPVAASGARHTLRALGPAARNPRYGGQFPSRSGPGLHRPHAAPACAPARSVHASGPAKARARRLQARRAKLCQQGSCNRFLFASDWRC